MDMGTLMAVVFKLVLSSISIVDPMYPPNAVMGGTVVAELHFASGAVQGLNILSGEEPFVSSCKSALAQWLFHPEQSDNELVIVHFRQPYLYFWGSTKEEIPPAKQPGRLPYPKYLIQPSYPADAQGQGSVVLRAEISAEGRVSDVKVVQSMGALTGAGIDAVQKWEFLPAKDVRGMNAPSHAYVVLVFRFPLMAP